MNDPLLITNEKDLNNYLATSNNSKERLVVDKEGRLYRKELSALEKLKAIFGRGPASLKNILERSELAQNNSQMALLQEKHNVKLFSKKITVINTFDKLCNDSDGSFKTLFESALKMEPKSYKKRKLEEKYDYWKREMKSPLLAAVKQISTATPVEKLRSHIKEFSSTRKSMTRLFILIDIKNFTTEQLTAGDDPILFSLIRLKDDEIKMELRKRPDYRSELQPLLLKMKSGN